MRLFAIKKTLKMGVKSLWMHRLRSTLTMLGIIFGVCSVVAMLAIGEGASAQAQETIAQLGSTNLIIETVEPPQEKTESGDATFVNSYGLTYKDVEAIRDIIPNVEVSVPIREIDNEARYLIRKALVKVIGSVPWYTETSPIDVFRGRFLSSIDLHHQQSVCIIDEKAARELFLFEDPMGKSIQMQGSLYRVVGLARAAEVASEQNVFDNELSTLATSNSGEAGRVYIPLTTARRRFNEYSYTYTSGRRNFSKVELQKVIVKVERTDQVLEMRGVLDALLVKLHDGKNDYKIIVPLELLRQSAQMTRIFSIVLGSIAAISLLVGGIGIMNIMLASVSERTREIGVRRALGAKRSDIIAQFLTETVMLTLSGGAIGIALGSLIPLLVTHFGNMPTIITGWSLIMAFGISGAIGVTFGMYPAYRAAHMDPIESLRHE